MGTEVDILTAALDRVDTYATALPIAWPNVNFEPPASGLWIEAAVLPNETGEIGWGADARREYLGLIQIAIYFRPGTGIVTATEEAEAIADHFPKGLVIGPVEIAGRGSLAPAIYEEGKGHIRVTIPYRGIA